MGLVSKLALWIRFGSASLERASYEVNDLSRRQQL